MAVIFFLNQPQRTAREDLSVITANVEELQNTGVRTAEEMDNHRTINIAFKRAHEIKQNKLEIIQ